MLVYSIFSNNSRSLRYSNRSRFNGCLRLLGILLLVLWLAATLLRLRCLICLFSFCNRHHLGWLLSYSSLLLLNSLWLTSAFLRLLDSLVNLFRLSGNRRRRLYCTVEFFFNLGLMHLWLILIYFYSLLSGCSIYLARCIGMNAVTAMFTTVHPVLLLNYSRSTRLAVLHGLTIENTIDYGIPVKRLYPFDSQFLSN